MIDSIFSIFATAPGGRRSFLFLFSPSLPPSPPPAPPSLIKARQPKGFGGIRICSATHGPTDHDVTVGSLRTDVRKLP